jgi:hypothetical protein
VSHKGFVEQVTLSEIKANRQGAGMKLPRRCGFIDHSLRALPHTYTPTDIPLAEGFMALDD